MKEKTNCNPMRWLMYIAVFWLFVDIVLMYMDATVSGVSEICGITFDSRGPLNPLAPFRVTCMILFLFLYAKHSKYAWHVMMILLLLNIPLYWILRSQAIYYRPLRYAKEDWFLITVWAGFLLWMIKLRPRYFLFISSNEGLKNENTK